jgi:hypothetical protein
MNLRFIPLLIVLFPPTTISASVNNRSSPSEKVYHEADFLSAREEMQCSIIPGHWRISISSDFAVSFPEFDIPE